MHPSPALFGVGSQIELPFGVPGFWHWFALHTTVVPEHPPLPSHTSPNVVRLLSLHASPALFGVGSQVELPFGVPGFWHWFALQTTVVPEHPPLPSHASPNVVRLLSLHASPALFGVGSQVELPFGVPGFWH